MTTITKQPTTAAKPRAQRAATPKADPHADLRAKAGTLLAALRPTVEASIPEGRGIAQRLLKLALTAIETAETDSTDPNMVPAWLEEGFADLNALIVGASWAPGAPKGQPWTPLIRGFDLLHSSGLLVNDEPNVGPKVNPAALAPHELTGWRAKTASMLSHVGAIIQETLDLDQTGTWPETGMLLLRAENVCEAMTEALLDVEHLRDEARWQSFELLALLRGAKCLDDTPKAIRLVLDTAIDLVDAATGTEPYLDGPGDDEPGHTHCDAEPAQHRTPGAASAKAEPACVTQDTELPHGGNVAIHLMQKCTYEVEALSKRLMRDADEGMVTQAFTDNQTGLLLRSTGARIHELNSLLMSYLCEDSVTLAQADWTINHDCNRAELDELIAREGGQQ